MYYYSGEGDQEFYKVH